MNRKTLLGLILFGCVVIAGLYFGVSILTGNKTEKNKSRIESVEDKKDDTNVTDASGQNNNGSNKTEDNAAAATGIPSGQNSTGTINANPAGNITGAATDNQTADETGGDGNTAQPTGSVAVSGIKNTMGTDILTAPEREFIIDYTQVNYKAYIPQMIYNNTINAALNIQNPKIDVDAKSAILFDADTKEVLFYKDPVIPVFPASTAKLLTSLTALDWCTENDAITVGDEVGMIAKDSTVAYLYKGEVLSINNLLAGMLVPSGNDAAYATAAYVGRKSLNNPNATKEEAIREFVRLMNLKAQQLGAVNSCFKTPDGYDALGQYTTAYDMGMIGLAAAENETILSVTKKSRSRNILISGQDVTWDNTNSLINRNSGNYYSCCIGLKTGTSSLAGRCLIAAGLKDGKKVVCVIMDSTSQGRWKDATKLLKYGLSR